MKSFRLLGLVLVLSGCAQLKSSGASSSGSSSNEGPTGPGSEVGKSTTPSQSGRVQMPFLTTLSEAKARATLAESGIKGEIRADKTECYDKTIPSGHVCNTVPAGGEYTWTTSTIVLFVVP